MVDYTLTIISTLQQISEEMGTVGIHESALPEVIRQYNQVLSLIKEKDPDNPVWSIVCPLDPGVHTCAELTLACTMLNNVAQEWKNSQSNGTWVVDNPDKPVEINGHYVGTVIVEPNCSFHIGGMVQGNIILKGNARLHNGGRITGNISKDPEAEFVNGGSFQGSVQLL